MKRDPTLLPSALNPLNSSPPWPVTLPRFGVEVPVLPRLMEEVMREISRVRRTYSNAAVSAPAALSTFSSSAMSSFVIELSGAER